MLKDNSIMDKINSLDKNEVLFFSCLILVLSTGWVIAQDSITPVGTVAGAASIPYEWESDPNIADTQDATATNNEGAGSFSFTFAFCAAAMAISGPFFWT